MSDWSHEIEDDLSWREAEMGSLKLLAASAPPGSDRQRALLRACCALLYAHYEGFSKFCWELALSHIGKQSLTPGELIQPLALRAMKNAFGAVRSDTSDVNLWNFGETDFRLHCRSAASLPTDIDTGSNLWPNVAEKINESLGLRCGLVDLHRNELGQLLNRRNGIAHGEKLQIASLAKFQEFERAALLVMHELAIAVVDLLDNKTYLRPTERIAVPITT